jgi:hypothetical protein
MSISVVRRGLLTGLILAALIPVHESQAKAPKHLTTLMALNGRCNKLIGFGMDVSQQCDNKLAHMEYSDGRLLFTFTATKSASDVAVFSFSGNGKQQTHQDADTVIQPIDHMLATFGGKTDTIKAAGKCLFTNPYKGQAIINCSVETQAGQFAGNFLTDGNEPNVQDMSQEQAPTAPGSPQGVSGNANFDQANTELSQCLLPKIQYGQYSSYDGGKSALNLLEDGCVNESSRWIEACVASGNTRENCNEKAVILAQASIKMMGK